MHVAGPSISALGLLVLVGACERDQCSAPSRCVDNVAINCGEVVDGEIGSHLERSETDCGELFCRTPGGAEGSAFCALTATPDPHAPTSEEDEAIVTGCRDGRMVTWQWGFAIAELDCGIGHVCVDDTDPGLEAPCGREAFCALDDELDPRCGPGIGTTCVDDETMLWCHCGFARAESSCSTAAPYCVLEATPGLPEQGVCRTSP